MPPGPGTDRIGRVNPARPAGGAKGQVPRVARAAALPLAVLALTGMGLMVLLALSPLNEMPDTYCQTALRPAVGAGCSEVTERRWRWIVCVAAVVAALAVGAWRTRRGVGPLPINRVRGLAAIVLLAGAALALVAAAYLTIGKNHAECGSTLSRVDEHGSYAPDRPKECAPSYAASRRDAWIFGLLSLAVFGGGAVLNGSGDRSDSEKPRN